tara:strand:+ start:81986 stop:82756 length:771 start_codon:yes stop_codon:yes gene_type:complete
VANLISDVQRNRLLDHAFWHQFFTIMPKPNEGLMRIAEASHAEQVKFLTQVVDAFYVLPVMSTCVFKRMADLTDGEPSELATLIHETEVGLHPIIKGTRYDNIPHPEQYKLMIASLLDDCTIHHNQTYVRQFMAKTQVQHASLSQAIAMAELIETTAPSMIRGIEDFVAQWQVYTGRSSHSVKRNYLYEHGLTEGDESDEQHIVLVDKIVAQYGKDLDPEQSEEMTETFIDCYHQTLDQVMRQCYAVSPSITCSVV